MPDRLPDFLGIGTQKGGTTSLHEWLSTHPQVFIPKCKEVHYFDLNYEKSTNWYSKHFRNASKMQKCGEITPFYLFHNEAAKRIKKKLPNVRLIVLLRDPVERTISQILHAKKRGFETLTVEEAIYEEENRMKSGQIKDIQRFSYVSRSKYIEQLEQYERYFDKSQIKIIKSENLFSQPDSNWQDILDFLGIENTTLRQELPHANQSKEQFAEIPTCLRQELREKLRETAIQVKKKYGFGWDWA